VTDVDVAQAPLPTTEELVRRYPQLQRLTAAHLTDVSAAFVAIVPDYFLSALGAPYLARTFWRVFCDAPECFGFVWMDGPHTVGFVAGSLERDRFTARVIAQAPFSFFVRLAYTALTTPRFLLQGLGLVRALTAERMAGGPDAELISLGVLPRAVRAVEGPDRLPISPSRVLIAAAAAHMRERGTDSFRLYTGVANRLACAFYRRLGFREAHRFRLFAEDKVCFTAATDDARLTA
jgi:GNAT superfamily N-acetyltransferase